MYSDIIFQILPSCSRPMTSHHVTCHVTVVSHASSLSKRKRKEKRKENQYKIRKIKEKKNKIVSVQASYNTTHIETLSYTSPAVPFSYIPPFLLFFLLLIVSLLPPIFLQSFSPIPLHFSNFPPFPTYHSLL